MKNQDSKLLKLSNDDLRIILKTIEKTIEILHKDKSFRVESLAIYLKTILLHMSNIFYELIKEMLEDKSLIYNLIDEINENIKEHIKNQDKKIKESKE
jgi:hypothetical protein